MSKRQYKQPAGENNGVHPDIEHVISVDDFRAGFVDYMAHFSDELVRRIDAVESPAQTE